MLEAVHFIQDFAIIMLSAALAGYVCKRIGLSPIVGYLLAGLVVGTPEITFPYVTDAVRIHTLSQVGVVFLMFAIGMGFRLKRFRELGLPLVGATVITALLVLNLVRGVTALAGYNAIEGLFLAAMLMVSSSAVIGKVLMENNATHERRGQLAMGMSLLEDIVAVIMLTLLGSYITAGESSTGAHSMNPWQVLSSVGLLLGFALLMLITGLVIVPRLLKYVVRTKSEELEAILIAGLLFGLSLLTVKAGYSLALGAFVLGMIVAETPRLAAVERTFAGMRDVFTTVFFVAIGMSIDIKALPDSLGLIAVGTVIALVGRSLAATLGLFAICEESKTAIRSGLSMTPIGEFSFIIAGLGVAGKVIPETFQVAAVGVSLLTGLISPLLISHSGAIADKILARPLPFLANGLSVYRNLWANISRIQQSNILLKLSRKRLIQIFVEIIVVTALLVFSDLVRPAVIEALSPLVEMNLSVLSALYWTVLLVICLVPLVAIWRNIDALSLILADFIQQERPQLARISPLIGFFIRGAGALMLLLWFSNFIPVGSWRGWFLLGLVAIFSIVIIFGWRHMVNWHSHLETTFESSLQGKSQPKKWTAPPWGTAQMQKAWGLSLVDCHIPDRSVWAGKSLGEAALRHNTGCSVVCIERHGFLINSPGPQSHLFPGDTLLLLGEPGQLKVARNLLQEETAPNHHEPVERLHSTVLESVTIPVDSPVIGKTLAELNWPRLKAVQVAGIRRGSMRQAIPGGEFKLFAGDEVLLIGTPAQIKAVGLSCAKEALL
ncbi:MAG: cation:proton antiporter [Verrucomicrobiota bacterium]|nr:cation:proton antiporter [Verrucomicrobiota bacterium]